MDAFLHEFKAAYNEGNGYNLSMTLYPVAPSSAPNRLRAFHHSTNYEHVKKDLEYRLLYDDRSPLNCPIEEARAWVDVYCAFWKFVGLMIKAENVPEDNSKDAWTKVYESWKDVTNTLHRGYSACGFEAWTVPCLYVAGKYLRIFAIKADEAKGNAEKYLTEAWKLCHKSAIQEQRLFAPLSRCIKKGDLAGFDAALLAGENEFVKRRIYLTLERGRDIALRNLLRKVFIAGGYEETKEPTAAPVRKTRIQVAEFAAAISIGSKETMENDEVECLLANMIYKSLMKGYISRERGIVVLSKGGAFPGTGV
ncbi:hypothetical protein DID88_008563 [Monilinia fructigena]|uniref:Protein CSN12 homolog n=1 Tax=Monilinia fructigena TaxID=38457 RepID=A0A395J5S6_9HELO|nr:hypothetical protein DID88_008563 [Monilinia fructigena]